MGTTLIRVGSHNKSVEDETLFSTGARNVFQEAFRPTIVSHITSPFSSKRCLISILLFAWSPLEYRELMYGGVRVLGGETSTKHVRETKQNIDDFLFSFTAARRRCMCRLVYVR